MRNITFTILICFCTPAFAFVFKLKDITETNSKTSREFSFPILTSHSQAGVAQKINDLLQLAVLYQKVGKHKTSIFENIWPVEDAFGNQSMGYSVFTNNGFLFSIAFFYETMGAYPDHSEQYFTFNAQSGDLLELDDFFLEQGFLEFDKFVRTKYKDVIYSEIQDIAVSAKEDTDDDDFEERLEGINSLLECCINQKIEKFFIDNKGINIRYYDGYCLPKALRAKDIGWDLTIPYSELDHLLNEFGKEILINKTNPVSLLFPEKHQTLVLRGLINAKYAFFLYVNFSHYNKYDNQFSIYGNYWYDKVGKSIDLSGSTTDRVNFEIFERDENQEEVGLFKIKFSDGKPSGTWTDLKTDKEFKIVFSK